MFDTGSPKNGQALVRAKKTFLEFKFCVHGDSDRLRRDSAPARMESDEQIWLSEASTMEPDELVLWTSEAVPDDDDDESSMQKPVDEISGGSSDRFDACSLDGGGKHAEECCDHVLDGLEPFVNAIANVEEEDVFAEDVLEAKLTDSDEVDTFSPKPGRALMKTSNTFLEFKFISFDESDRLRRASAPACVEHLDCEDMIWSSEASGLDSCGVVLWTSESPDNDDTWSSEGDHGPGGSRAKSKRNRNRLRPCKGKRTRIRKFVARLCEQVDKDPVGFNEALIEWPPSMENSKHRQQVLGALSTHRTKVLQEIALNGEVCEKCSLPLGSFICRHFLYHITSIQSQV